VYSYSLYAKRDTFLHNLAPVTKIIIPFTMMTLTILTVSPLGDLLILIATVGLLVNAKIPASTLKPYVRITILLSVVFSINWLIFGKPGIPIITIGWFKVTMESLNAIITSILRLLVLILNSIVLMAITSESELIEGLRKLRIPYVICFILMMAIRFIPTLASDMTMIREAQMSRGTEFEKGSLMDRGRKLAALVIPLLVVSFRRVEVIGTGLEARAFNPFGSAKRTFFRRTSTKLSDKVLIAIAIVALLGASAYAIYHGINP